MAVKELGDGGPDGVRLGVNSSELVSMHGKTPIALAAVASVATGATIATVVTWARALHQALVDKGVISF